MHSTINATTIEKTEVLYGTENINKALLRFVSNGKKGWNACADSTAQSVTIEHSKKLLLDAKNSGVKVKLLTDITKDNWSYCKELMEIVYELRHLDGVKGNFGVSEIEYLASATLQGVRYITFIDKDNGGVAKILLNSGVKLKHVKNLPPMSFGVSDKEMGATIEKIDLILTSRNDAKLAESIKWIDLQSQKNGTSFYDMVYIIADKQLTKKRAQQWLSQNMHPSRNQ